MGGWCRLSDYSEIPTKNKKFLVSTMWFIFKWNFLLSFLVTLISNKQKTIMIVRGCIVWNSFERSIKKTSHWFCLLNNQKKKGLHQLIIMPEQHKRIWFHRNRINYNEFNSLMMIIILSILSSSTLLINAFNLDTFTALIQRGPTDTYFGFSVALHKDRNVSW